MVQELGLSDVLEPALETSQDRFIAKGGRLHAVPMSPGAILGTGLLTARDKVRIFLEPFIAARREESDESVYDFASRRIGTGAADSFIDPMVSGIFGGLARQLSLPACFPVMREMETRYGGLVRAMIARRAGRSAGRNRADAVSGGGPAGPGGRLTSFKGGLDRLVTRLEERLRTVVRTGRQVVRIASESGEWEAADAQGRRVRADILVCACPTYAAARIFRADDPELSTALGAIPYAPIAVVATGHRRQDIRHPLSGFGFLIPRSEGLRTLGSIWTSSIFTERAPASHVQFRTMLGGAGDPAAADLSDSELWGTVRTELGPFVGVGGEPVLMRIYRWQAGIPQYTLGHIGRRARIEQLARGRPGLYFVGNAYYGVGLNDCVKMAHRVAHRIKESRQSQ
jgi:oxygen-dependent protoporphyrinogen oxidase